MLVEVMHVVSALEKEELAVNLVKTTLQDMMVGTGFDTDGDNLVSQEEFNALLMNPKAARMVEEVGVDVVGLVDFSDYIFQEGEPLTFVEFMEVVLSFRGCNNSTVKDIVDLRKFVAILMSEQKSEIEKMARAIQRSVQAAIGRLQSGACSAEVSTNSCA